MAENLLFRLPDKFRKRYLFGGYLPRPNTKYPDLLKNPCGVLFKDHCISRVKTAMAIRLVMPIIPTRAGVFNPTPIQDNLFY